MHFKNPYEYVAEQNEFYIGKLADPTRPVFYQGANGRPYARIRVHNSHGDNKSYKVDSRSSGSRHPENVIEKLSETHGWEQLTAFGHLTAFGCEPIATRWPETGEAGGPLVGLATFNAVDSPFRIGRQLGLYKNGDALVPHGRRQANVSTHGGDTSAVRLPKSPLRDEYTVDLTEYDSVGSAVRELQQQRFWHSRGYPQDVTMPGVGDTKVCVTEVQIGPEFVSTANSPRSYNDNGTTRSMRTEGMKHFD